MQKRLLGTSLTFAALLASATAWADESVCRVAADALSGSASTDAFTRAVGQGPLYAGGAAFLGGLATSLTPCVYPMIAVTVSVFGAHQTRSRARGLALSAAFVLGIVAMFVPAGVIAGMTGGLFGAILQSRAVLLGISALFLALGASMLGAFEFALPSRLVNRLSQAGGIGLRGAFVLGLVSGIIAAPCTGPVLTGILLWIGKSQDALMGAGAMAAFGLGLGLPFFVVGAFAVQLPKSGRWMVHVKSLLGLVLVIVALHFITTAFPQLGAYAIRSPGFFAAMGALAVVGLLLGALHRSFDEPGWRRKLGKGIGIACVGVAGVGTLAGLSKPASSLAWESLSYANAREKASKEGRPLLVDFTAEWCQACKKLDRATFSAPMVASEAGRFVAVKVDATHDDDPEVEQVKDELEVVGLPTVLLFDSAGKEVVRCTDFVPAESFLTVLERVE